jgi:DNA-binding LacI/PurR family transcriptional regulator
MSITIIDVAREAGVAVKTVSRVFGNNPSVRHYIKERVLENAKRLNYVPNLAARTLRSKRSNFISIAVKCLDNPFFGALTTKLCAALREKGYEPILAESINEIEDLNLRLHAAGSILILPYFPGKKKKLSGDLRAKTLAITGGYMGRIGIPNFDFDFSLAYQEIVQKLYSEKRKKIIYLTGDNEIKALHKNRKFLTLERILSGKTGRVISAFSESEFLEKKIICDADFCENDTLALKAAASLMMNGINVPEKTRVIGCDAIFKLPPRIWSVKIDLDNLALHAVSALLKIVRGEKVVSQKIKTKAFFND